MSTQTQPRSLSKPSDAQRQFKQIMSTDSFQAALRATLPKHIRADRMIRVVLAAMSQSEKLQQCTQDSVLLSVMRAAACGLEPDGGPLGQAYLVPYWNGKRHAYECQFIPGYRGMIKLARNSGEVADVWAEVVYEADEFSYELGVDQKLTHKRNDDAAEPGPLRYAYAVARFRDGEKKFVVLNRRQIETIKARSSSKDKEGRAVGPWVEWEAEMWKKTAVKQLCKYLPLSAETSTALAQEDTPLEAQQLNVLAMPKLENGRQEEEPEADTATVEGTVSEAEQVQEEEQKTSQTPDMAASLSEAYDRFRACNDLMSVNELQKEVEASQDGEDWKAQVSGLAEEARDRIRTARGARSNSK